MRELDDDREEVFPINNYSQIRVFFHVSSLPPEPSSQKGTYARCSFSLVVIHFMGDSKAIPLHAAISFKGTGQNSHNKKKSRQVARMRQQCASSTPSKKPEAWPSHPHLLDGPISQNALHKTPSCTAAGGKRSRRRRRRFLLCPGTRGAQVVLLDRCSRS